MGGKMMTPTVSVMPVEYSSIAEVIQLTGTVEPVRVARLASPVEGPVQTLWAREGDTVRAGKVLLDIGRKGGASAQLAAAREYFQKQEQELERVKTLVADGALPGSELDGARALYETARAQHIRAGEATGDFRIAAPWSGIVSEMFVKEGDFVAPRTPLLQMYDPSKLVVLASVPEMRSTALHERAPVEIRFDAYPGRTFKGMVSRIYPRLDIKTRSRTFEVSVKGPITLIPGMFARLDVETSRADSVIVVSQNAVITTPKGEVVVFVIQNGAAVACPVVTGIRQRDKIQITQGLSTGEKLVVAGNEKLKNGAIVRVAGGKEGGPSGKVGAKDSASGKSEIDTDKAHMQSEKKPGKQGMGK
jgi:RND family efflux transporter MFP subunit